MSKVLIVNLGKEAVKVEVQKRDAAGRYRALTEHKLRAGASKRVVVEFGQSVQVIDPNEPK